MKYIAFIISLFVGFQAHAQNAYTTTPAEQGKITEERIYTYNVKRYTVPVKVQNIQNPGQVNHQSAEDVALHHVSAMLELDYNHWISLWHAEERKALLRQHAIKGQNEFFWKDLWAKTFAEYEAFELTKRVESDPFVIIEMRASAGEKELLIDIPLVKYQRYGVTKFYVTDKLEGDPVFKHWRNNGHIIRKQQRKAQVN